jgi:hypothetical protein
LVEILGECNRCLHQLSIPGPVSPAKPIGLE